VTPRYFTWFVHGMVTPVIFICCIFIVDLLLNIIATVLLVLMPSLQFVNQDIARSICFCRAMIAYLGFRFEV